MESGGTGIETNINKIKQQLKTALLPAHSVKKLPKKKIMPEEKPVQSRVSSSSVDRIVRQNIKKNL